MVIGAGLVLAAMSRSCARRRNICAKAAIPFSLDYMERKALSRNPDIASLLVELFHTLNNPADAEKATRRAFVLTQTRIDKALNDVPSLDDDRIVRRLRNVIASVMRTNFYQQDSKTARPRFLSSR